MNARTKERLEQIYEITQEPVSMLIKRLESLLGD